MAMFAGILDRIRTKKKAMALNAQNTYHKLLKEVVSGKEVNTNEAAIVIDAAGKTEDEFESDVRTMEQRFTLAEQRKARLEVERTLPKFRAALEAANQAYADAVQRLQPQINAAYVALQNAENQQMALVYVDNKLNETCLDKSLLAREKELLASRMAIMQKRRPLFEDAEYAKQYLRTCSETVDSLVQNKKDESHPDHQSLRHWKSELAKQESIVSQLSKAIADLDAELLPINQELAELAEKKLLP
jgi:hypothetical protein